MTTQMNNQSFVGLAIKPARGAISVSRTKIWIVLLISILHSKTCLQASTTTQFVNRLRISPYQPNSITPKSGKFFKSWVRLSSFPSNDSLKIELYYHPIESTDFEGTKVLSITVPFIKTSDNYEDNYVVYSPLANNSLYRTTGDMTLSVVDEHFYVFVRGSWPLKLVRFGLRCRLSVKRDENRKKFLSNGVLNFSLIFEDSKKLMGMPGGLSVGNAFKIELDSRDAQDLSYNPFLFTGLIFCGIVVNFILEILKLWRSENFAFELTVEWFGHNLSHISLLISTFANLSQIGGIWKILGWMLLFMLSKLGEIALSLGFILNTASKTPKFLKSLKYAFLTKMNLLSLSINIFYIYMTVAVSPRYIFHAPMLLLVCTAIDLIFTKNAYIRSLSSLTFIRDLFVINFGNQFFYYGVYYLIFFDIYFQNPIDFKFFIYPYLVAYPSLWVLSLFKMRICDKRIRVLGRRMQKVKKIEISGKVDFLYSKESLICFRRGGPSGERSQVPLTGDQLRMISKSGFGDYITFRAKNMAILSLFTSPASSYVYIVRRSLGYASLECFPSIQPTTTKKRVKSTRKWVFRLNSTPNEESKPVRNVWYQGEKKDNFLAILNESDSNYSFKLIALRRRKVLIQKNGFMKTYLNPGFSYFKLRFLDIYIADCGSISLIYSYMDSLFQTYVRRENSGLLRSEMSLRGREAGEGIAASRPECIGVLEDENEVEGFEKFGFLSEMEKNLKFVKNSFFEDLVACLYIYEDGRFLDRDYINKGKFQNILIFKIGKRASSHSGGPRQQNSANRRANGLVNGSRKLASLHKITEGCFSSWRIDEIFLVTRTHLCVIMGDKIALIDWENQKIDKMLDIPNLFSYRAIDHVFAGRESLDSHYYACFDYKRRKGLIYFCLGRSFEDLQGAHFREESCLRHFVSGLYLGNGVYDVSGVIFDGVLRGMSCERPRNSTQSDGNRGRISRLWAEQKQQRGSQYTGMLTQSLIYT